MSITAVLMTACDEGTPDPPRDGPVADGAIDGAIVDAGVVDGGALDAVDAAIDAAPDASDGCATAPTGDWEGVASHFRSGGSNSDETIAAVRWTLAATVACVDRYVPSGTATSLQNFTGRPDQMHTVPLAPTDGVLTIDRTTAPPTYRMTGASVGAGGTWADLDGAFDRDLMSGGFDDDDFAANRWRFVRVGATFTPPTSGCSEPATETWTGTASLSWGTRATVTWTRIETVGCVDRFAPSGIAEPRPPHPSCTADVYAPPSGPIAADDGALVIDRSTDPPTYRMSGETEWDGTRTCTHADGSEQITTGLGGPWAWYLEGSFDGDAWSGGTLREPGIRHTWSLRRGP